jgi:hypothetical protein
LLVDSNEGTGVYLQGKKMEKEVANMKIGIVAEIKNNIIVPQPALGVFQD